MGKRYAGLNVPVFSLRSKKSLGCGEFLDLLGLIDWADEAGFNLLQLLPIHDTSITKTKNDRSPYPILSAFSLHPIYLNVQALAPEYEESFINPIVKKLNLPEFEYESTYLAKIEFLKMLYVFRGEKDLSTKSFETFFAKNESHLKAYGAFCVLRDHFKTSNFKEWGEYARYSELLVEEVSERFDVRFYYFIQYHLHKQLKEVKQYAKMAGILLKGDFTMGVHAHSVEAWRFNEYFKWDQSMGAPPDFYNSIGQNWGFPSYKWKEIKEEGYFFLKERLKWMEQYFDVIRLDHVLGYFRLWEIPVEEVRGLMGSFFPSVGYSESELASQGFYPPFGAPFPEGFHQQREVKRKVKDPEKRVELYEVIEDRLFIQRDDQWHPRVALDQTTTFRTLDPKLQKKALELSRDYFEEGQEAEWERAGKEKLTFIQKQTSMLLCAEDIGVAPTCVERVLSDLKILSLHIQRMPKDAEEEFEDSNDFPVSCVCTPSNHDMSTLRQWWEEDQERTTVYFHTILKRKGTPPKHLTEELAEAIIRSYLHSKAQMAIFLLQDLFAMSDAMKFPRIDFERINDPAKGADQWKWRSHIYIEELLLAKGFTVRIREMIQKAKR